MNYLINFMATGNNIIIVCKEKSNKMFPFHDELPCLLPIGNKRCLSLLIETIRLHYDGKITILAPSDIGILKIADEYKIEYIKKEQSYIQQLYEITKECFTVAIFQGEVVLHNADIKQVILQLINRKAGILIKKFSAGMHSMDTIAVHATAQIHAIFAYPREHYVNAQIGGAFVLDVSSIFYLKYCMPGFHNVNCGQMPNENYYLEEAIQNAIEAGIAIDSIWCENRSVILNHAWDIREANELVCEWLNVLQYDDIKQSASIDDSTIRKGFLRVGANSIIKEYVIFEGNCIIGDNVIIEKGAIIGANCIINHGSKIQYYCKINQNTVIGSNNKIGFHAEISGVTFDGVCAVHNCEVFGVIGKKVDIAAGVQMAILRFDDMPVTQNIAGKKFNTPYTNTVCIGNYSRTGVNNVFLPGVKIGSRSALGPCLMIEKDIEENSLITVIQETKLKKWGSERYGW